MIPTANPNEISAKLTFDGALPSIELKWLDKARHEEIASGATVSQTISGPWCLSISNETVDRKDSLTILET